MSRDLPEPIVDHIIELTYNNFKTQREEQRLDPHKIKEFKQQYIKPLYPHVVDQQHQGSKRRYRCCEACGADAGRFSCCDSKIGDSNFIKFGLAICLYFKFLKHANLYFILIALLSVTACGVCYAVSVQNDFQPTTDYSTFLFSLGYGTFSSQHVKCQYGMIVNNQVNISASCPNGLLNSSVISSLPVVFTSQSKNTLYNCRNERKSAQIGTYLAYPFVLNKTVTTNNENTQVFSLTFNGSQSYQLVSYVYECYNNVYNISKLSSKSDNYFLYVVLTDLVFTLFFIVFLCSESRAEQKEIKFFNQEQVALDSFSVMIQGINRNELDKQLTGLMAYFTDKVSSKFKESVVSVTIPQVSTQIDQQEERRQIYEDFYNLIDRYYFANSQKLLPFNQCNQITQKLFEPQELAFMRNQLKKYTHRLLSLSRRQAIKESDEQITVFFVFDRVNMKDSVLTQMQKKCCSKRLVCPVNGKEEQFQLLTPPMPDSIIWQNHKRWSKLRTLLMWIVTAGICFGSYVLFGFIQYKQAQLLSTYNYNIDCKVLYPTVSFLTYNETLASQSNNYLTCYCNDKSLLDVVSAQTDYCTAWQRQYLLYKAIPLLISLGIVMFNIIVSYAFIYLTKFQRHRFAHQYELSYAFKRAFMLILNMGLILILLNLNYNNNTFLTEVNFLFLGKYNDFTPDWYNNIGTIITLTILFNISFPIIELFLAYIFKCFKKCWDTRCCNVSTSRKTKKQYIDYYNDEIYPIGERYAYLMATFFVSMSFCGIIPVLVPITAICLILLYFIDKILIFSYYQTPLNYAQTLHKAFLVVLYVSIISHCALTSYFLSQPTLIATSFYIPGTTSSVSSGNARLDNMIKTGYILPYLGFLALLVIYAIFKEFILRFFAWLYRCCCISDELNIKSAVVQKSTIYDILSDSQRQTLKMALERELQNIQILKKENSRIDFGAQEDINQTQRAYVNALTIQEEIVKNSLRQIAIRLPSERNLKLLGQPSYQAHSKYEQIQKEKQMLEFEHKLKGVVSGDKKKRQMNNMAAGFSNQTQQQLYLHINI